MDQALQNILINTYNIHPEIRKEAENALKQFLQTNQFLLSFIIIIDGYRNQENVPTIHRDIRVAALLIVKNNIREFWAVESTKKYPITPQEKEICREKILEIMLIEPDTILKGLLAETIRIISGFDYPDK